MIHLSLYVKSRDITLNQDTNFPFLILSNSFSTTNQLTAVYWSVTNSAYK